jgi:hypothetical protein
MHHGLAGAAGLDQRLFQLNRISPSSCLRDVMAESSLMVLASGLGKVHRMLHNNHLRGNCGEIAFRAICGYY